MFKMWTLSLLVVAMMSAAVHGENDLATQVYQQTGFQGGIVVELGMVDVDFTAALGAREAVTTEILETNVQRVTHARESLENEFAQTKGPHSLTTVLQFDGKNLPYADNLVNLVVMHQDSADRDDIHVEDQEVLRVLAPGGALCAIRGPGEPNRLRIVKKPWPKDIDDWTHFLHDASGNAVAADSQVAPATAMQWVSGPMFCRSHEIDSSMPAMVSAQGRLFYFLDEGPIGITDPRFPAQWKLIARDAFNGTLLWKQPLKPWGWQVWKPEIRDDDWRTLRGQRGRFPTEVPRRLVADGDRVYVTLGFYDAPLSILDGATGQVLAQCAGHRGDSGDRCRRGHDLRANSTIHGRGSETSGSHHPHSFDGDRWENRCHALAAGSQPHQPVNADRRKRRRRAAQRNNAAMPRPVQRRVAMGGRVPGQWHCRHPQGRRVDQRKIRHSCLLARGRKLALERPRRWSRPVCDR